MLKVSVESKPGMNSNQYLYPYSADISKKYWYYSKMYQSGDLIPILHDTSLPQLAANTSHFYLFYFILTFIALLSKVKTELLIKYN